MDIAVVVSNVDAEISNVWVTVKGIETRGTVVRPHDGRRVFIPNGEICDPLIPERPDRDGGLIVMKTVLPSRVRAVTRWAVAIA